MKRRESKNKSLIEKRKSLKEEVSESTSNQTKGAVVFKAGANAFKKGFVNINGKFKGMVKTKE